MYVYEYGAIVCVSVSYVRFTGRETIKRNEQKVEIG
nr:MAG TPA: hypothetical protein [Caudoviricetes sp.]